MDTKNISRKKLEKENRSALKRELKDFDRQGVSLVLDGCPSSPGQIAKACCLAEEGTYMRDYVSDEKGVICEVHFDYIKPR